MQLTFLGATHTVTGSKFLLTTHTKKYLIDCGLFQGYKELRLRNWNPLPTDPHEVDAVILTHAHIDHTGYLPVLVKNGFKGKIYCTEGTKALCDILLPDSGRIQEDDTKRANKYNYTKHQPAIPLYTQGDALDALTQFYALNFNTKYTLSDGVTLEFFPAGHIIGASLVKIIADGKSILFTGDLGRPNDPLMKPPATINHIDYLIIESTYGNRLHETTDPLDQLANIIARTVARGGSVIIPAFAVGRTQDMLYYIYQLKQAKRIPDIPVFLDSPMAQDVSDLMRHYSNEHKLSPAMCEKICHIAKYVTTPEESKDIDQRRYPSIIISASGMLEGGRILHHLKIFLSDHRNTIVLTGYQAGGTRGDRLLRHEPEIKIHGQMIPARAELAVINNLSAHADYNEMIAWLKHLERAPKKIFIVHGEADSSAALKSKIEDTLGFKCVVPDYLQKENLE